MQYTIMIERGPTSYRAASLRRRRREVRRGVTLIKEAVELHLEGMRKDGDQIPAPTTIATVVEVAA